MEPTDERLMEVVIDASDLDSHVIMTRHRISMDSGARAVYTNAKFDREEITPYLIEIEDEQTKERRVLPETKDTLKYRVLRRFYR